MEAKEIDICICFYNTPLNYFKECRMKECIIFYKFGQYSPFIYFIYNLSILFFIKFSIKRNYLFILYFVFS